MTCNPYNIKVTEGNSFAVILTLKTRTYAADAPIDQDIDPTALADVHVKVNGAEWSAFTVGVEGVSVQFAATQPCGTYNVELTANYNGITIRAAYFECVTIVAWSYQSDAQNYIPDSPLSAKAAYIIAGNYTDAELEALKQQYRDAIEAAEQAEQDAEQAKEDYIAKADNLDNLNNVAQQGSNPNATNTAILDGINNITIDTSTLAQRTDVKDGNDTAISVSKEIRSEVGTSSDTASETGTTLFAVLKWVKDKVKSIFNLIGSPASGQPSTLFGAVGDIALSATTLQSLADSWAAIVTNRNSVDGWTFTAITPNGIGAALLNRNHIVIIVDNSVEYIDMQYVFQLISSCTYVELQRLNTIGNDNVFRAMPSVKVLKLPALIDFATSVRNTFIDNSQLEEFYLPNLERISANIVFQSNTHLKKLYMPKLTYINGSNHFNNDVNLIDLTLGEFNTSFNISTWSPTNALDSSSSSLVDDGETFANNLEKLLYNIREHIAANLATVAGGTITFSAAVKAAINADTATAAAFTNKGWTIA